MKEPMAGGVSVEALVLLLLWAFGLGYFARVWHESEPPADPVEQLLDERREELRERYVAGEITHGQFAAEIETVEDPDTERIMHLARDVDGIGPHIAFKIAREFDSLEALAAADQSDLEAINRVGENRAHGVLHRARQECD